METSDDIEKNKEEPHIEVMEEHEKDDVKDEIFIEKFETESDIQDLQRHLDTGIHVASFEAF